jgi:hypothetical protein
VRFSFSPITLHSDLRRARRVLWRNLLSRRHPYRIGHSGITGLLECSGELDRQIGMFFDYGLRQRDDVHDRVDARLFGAADNFIAIIEKLFDAGILGHHGRGRAAAEEAEIAKSPGTMAPCSTPSLSNFSVLFVSERSGFLQRFPAAAKKYCPNLVIESGMGRKDSAPDWRMHYSGEPDSRSDDRACPVRMSSFFLTTVVGLRQRS